MIKHEWMKTLQILYWQARKSPAWNLIKGFHDDDDRNYFRTLDKAYFPARTKPEEKAPANVLKIFDEFKIKQEVTK